jgi:hypothetical protein
MNKKFLPKTALVLAAYAASAYVNAHAMPLTAIDLNVGLVGRPIAQLPIQDPQVEQAIDVIKSKHLKQNNERKSPTTPETTISRAHHKDLDKVLILGGVENVPM